MCKTSNSLNSLVLSELYEQTAALRFDSQKDRRSVEVARRKRVRSRKRDRRQRFDDGDTNLEHNGGAPDSSRSSRDSFHCHGDTHQSRRVSGYHSPARGLFPARLVYLFWLGLQRVKREFLF